MSDNIIDFGSRLGKIDEPQPVSEDLVALIESLLESAKSGHTVGLVMVGISNEGHAMSAMHIPVYSDSSHTATAVSVLTGTIDRVKHRIYDEFTDVD